MVKLSEIVYTVTSNPHGSFYITADGECTPENDKFLKEARIRAEYDIIKVELPKAVKGYLEEKGILHLIDRAEAFSEKLTLRCLSDGREEIFTMTNFYLYSKTDRSLFSALGFDMWGDPEDFYAYGVYMGPEEYMRLADFLRDAGLRFRFDVPPWMEALPAFRAKPSSRRPGDEDARFFGFA